MNSSRTLLHTAAAVLACTYGAHAVAAGIMDADLMARSRAIHWPHIVDAARWPQWYPNSCDVQMPAGTAAIGAGARWRWTTFGFPIESRVHEFVPHAWLSWFGYPPDTEPVFYHAWLLQPRAAGCLVITDEAGIGPAAGQLRQSDEGLMHRGHDLWLATLKWMAEGP